jgi:geranylgeranyl reductase
MKMEKHDVVIIGAGPGGLTAARRLAPHKDVLVLERKPEERIGDKACTGILTPAAMGMIPESLYDGIYTGSMVYEDFDHPHPFSESPEISGLSHGLKIATIDPLKFGQYQLKEVERFGSEIRTQSSVKKVNKKENKIILRDGKEIAYDYLIGADGPTSIVARSIIPRKVKYTWYGVIYDFDGDLHLPMTFRNVFFEGKRLSLWTIPHKDHTQVSIYLSFDIETPRPQMIIRWFEKHGMDLKDAKIRKGPYSMYYRGFKYGNIFLIGDAGGFFNGWAGTGIYQAMVTGKIAANAIIDDKYNYKKDIKEILKTQRYGARQNYADDMVRWGIISRETWYKIEKRYLRWLRKMEISRLGFLALSVGNKISAKLMRYHPESFFFLYLSCMYVPSTITSWEIQRKMMVDTFR